MEVLKQLFTKYVGTNAVKIEALTPMGSHRQYYRMFAQNNATLIGVKGTDKKENEAFFYLSKHFLSKGINVPKVLKISPDKMYYIQEDIGRESLYDYIKSGRETGEYSPEQQNILCDAIKELAKIQFKGAEGLNFNNCYPENSFSPEGIMFDLNYFKYCFLKPCNIEFNEILLQKDFYILQQDLMQYNSSNTFLYRDFQSRNIMLKNNKPYFIDFQGGRKGPIYYDVAAFVWQAKAQYPKELKDLLINNYINAVKEFNPSINSTEFKQNLHLFVLFRTLQVLAAYGFRGYFERKTHFLESIPFAICNLKEIITYNFKSYPYLLYILQQITLLPQFNNANTANCLTVTIYSFSFKKGIPQDNSGNGGGYVFDCRAITNPGRYEQYKHLNGLDADVIKFLEDNKEITNFLNNIYPIIDFHIQRYIDRGFSNLMLNFGCTGGQHRSVYSAQHISNYIAKKFNVKITLIHRELNITTYINS